MSDIVEVLVSETVVEIPFNDDVQIVELVSEGATGSPGTPGADGSDGAPGAPGVEIPPFTVGGPIGAAVYTMRLYANRTTTIQLVRASVGVAPTGSSIVIDVYKNGVTIFTGGTDRPTIAAGTFTDTGVPAVTTLAAGDYLTVSIISAGSTIPGSDLVVQVVTQ